MSNGDVNRLLAEAAEQLKREAYSAGWRDAIEAVGKALAGVNNPSSIPETLSPTSEPGAARAGPNPSPTTRPAANVANVTPGSTPYYVLNAINTRPPMTSTELVQALRDAGHSAPEGSIRTSIFRLRDRRLITARHGRWFPVG